MSIVGPRVEVEERREKVSQAWAMSHACVNMVSRLVVMSHHHVKTNVFWLVKLYKTHATHN